MLSPKVLNDISKVILCHLENEFVCLIVTDQGLAIQTIIRIMNSLALTFNILHFFCVKCQAKNNILKNVESTVGYLQYVTQL